jgi:hypothetical protein
MSTANKIGQASNGLVQLRTLLTLPLNASGLMKITVALRLLVTLTPGVNVLVAKAVEAGAFWYNTALANKKRSECWGFKETHTSLPQSCIVANCAGLLHRRANPHGTHNEHPPKPRHCR